MSAARAARLPGFKFETQAPPLDEVLPRMDIAVFVGFAASGPLETPVAIESAAQFQGVFGQDTALAWDGARGEQLFACLAPAVRAFFANGGRRCWVIRVARRTASVEMPGNHARYNYFPVPGLACASFAADGKKVASVRPAFAQARSEGSWSDALRVGSALLSRSYQLGDLTYPAISGEDFVAQLAPRAAKELAPGDLLRLTFKDDRYVLFLVIKAIGEAKVNPQPLGTTVAITGRNAIWFQRLAGNNLPTAGTPAKVGVFAHESKFNPDDPVAGFEVVYDAEFDLLNSPPVEGDEDPIISLKLSNCPMVNAPSPGSIIRVDLAAEEWWLTVADVSFAGGATDAAKVSGTAFRRIDGPPINPVAKPVCECLTFELSVRKAEDYAVSLSNLGFASGHERFWGLLPTDEELYRPEYTDPTGEPAATLWRQTEELLRFPLAGLRVANAEANEIYFPLSIATVPDAFLGPAQLEDTPLERDGLAIFDSALFIDADLAGTLTEGLPSAADFLRYQSPRPRTLNGMHAAMALEEATIICVPDAVHRGWSPSVATLPPVPAGEASPLRPDWWPFLDCREAPAAPLKLHECAPQPAAPSPMKPIAEPLWGNFLNCSISIIDPPLLFVTEQLSKTGTYTLSWQTAPKDVAVYILQEAGNADFTDAQTIYTGVLTNRTIYGRSDGDYFYRVNATISSNTSDWSTGVAVRVATKSGFRLNAETGYQPDALLAVQRALLRLCAARGDLFGILSLPEHYREDQAIEHSGLLKGGAPSNVWPGGVPPLGAGEANDFSYGAVFHPWLVDRDESQNYRRTPPCGAVTGVIAKRALLRGAWVAPANEPIRGVVALEPPINRERYLELQGACINLVRQEPRGFIVLDADTLSDDPDFGLINVRRLLMLLRRQALRLGMTYVFEPNSAAFRRLVERGFNEMLDQMFIRGAFAGASPASAYQVVADDSLNTAPSVDQGRFIVELRVAPSLPLNFLTIRLVQNGDRGSITEGR